MLLGVLSPAKDFFSPLLKAGKVALYAGLLPAAAIYFLYHPLLEILMQGRTPGKRMAGIRIVTERALTPDAGALIIRNVFRLVDSLPAFYLFGLVVAMFTARQVRIGDLAAGTLLIYDTGKRSLNFDGVVGSASSRLSPGECHHVYPPSVVATKSRGPNERPRPLQPSRRMPVPECGRHSPAAQFQDLLRFGQSGLMQSAYNCSECSWMVKPRSLAILTWRRSISGS